MAKKYKSLKKCVKNLQESWAQKKNLWRKTQNSYKKNLHKTQLQHQMLKPIEKTLKIHDLSNKRKKSNKRAKNSQSPKNTKTIITALIILALCAPNSLLYLWTHKEKMAASSYGILRFPHMQQLTNGNYLKWPRMWLLILEFVSLKWRRNGCNKVWKENAKRLEKKQKICKLSFYINLSLFALFPYDLLTVNIMQIGGK